MHKHPFHLVTVSPWPLLSSISVFLLVFGLLCGLSNRGFSLFYSGLTLLLLTAIFWWVSVTHEATHQGHHTLKVQASLRLGISLLIISEAFFFLGFFWAYLHSSLSPAVEIGSLWPPAGITPLLACSVPLLNTCVLLVSAACVTFSHHFLVCGQLHSSQLGLTSAVLLGVFFTTLQALEYYSCSFSIADSVYGSCFFLATGFHGLHVIAGTLWLFVNLLRLCSFHFSSTRHLGLEFSIWYWHFVDVIWLLLFLVIYCWGS